MKSFVEQIHQYSGGVENYKAFPMKLKKELMHLATVELIHIGLPPRLGGPEEVEQWFLDKAKEIIEKYNLSGCYV